MMNQKQMGSGLTGQNVQRFECCSDLGVIVAVLHTCEPKQRIDNDQHRLIFVDGCTELHQSIGWGWRTEYENRIVWSRTHSLEVAFDFAPFLFQREIEHRALLGFAAQEVVAPSNGKCETRRKRSFADFWLSHE